MKSPADMRIIQIDITNACHLACSNCTRFCGNHKKPFSMGFETFKKAVDSMEGFRGVVGIMGGEPTLHPEFERFLEYYASKISEPFNLPVFTRPVKRFADFSRNLPFFRGHNRGLWTSLGRLYYKHFEVIQDVFPYQVINDHENDSQHQAILVTRRELGIPDKEWFKLRDNCWIQNRWSASITPKGAFFCEIAAALDTLFQGPGGWPIEKGWWKRKPADFGEQLNWCEMCSVALRVPSVSAVAEKDIVSPVMLEKLKAAGSPRITRGDYLLIDVNNYDASKYSHPEGHIPFLPEDLGDEARVSPTNEMLYPRDLRVAVLDGAGGGGTLDGSKALTVEDFHALKFPDWAVVFRKASDVNAEFVANISRCVLNPGCLYYANLENPRKKYRSGAEIFANAGVFVLNSRARALRGKDSLPQAGDWTEYWKPERRVALKGYPDPGQLGWTDAAAMFFERLRFRTAFLSPFRG